jgi:hypothetical protein
MCQERIRLVVDYRETTRTYADFVRKMTDLVGLGIESEVELLQRSCRQSWEAAEKARLALFRHEANHSVIDPTFARSALPRARLTVSVIQLASLSRVTSRSALYWSFRTLVFWNHP